ncbi:MAG: T9SS type A sorting domain-containing protein [Bacteroidota bacterium]|nr:T9SS type A sorting domain-containing protein [Bacteroidota bacterium]MDX5430947.1 T9SS type A sorting domain-containing protein [Bacteroidota bacterium]MDX5469695.1 T9SS type A sorting domain-containing protein [Bacteroidota bacterium]
MLKRLLFLLTLLGPAFVQAQELSENQLKKWGTQPDSSHAWFWNQNAWQSEVFKGYTHDGNNRVSMINEYNGTNLELEHRYWYTYDANDRLIEIWMEANFGGNLLPFRRYTTVYDAQGNRTSYKEEAYQNNTWSVLSGDSNRFSYDASNRVLEMEMFQLTGPNVYPSQKIIYSDYQSNNAPRTVTVQSYQGAYENYLQIRDVSWAAGFDLFNINPSAYQGYLWQSGEWKYSGYDTAIVENGKIKVNYLLTWNGASLDTSSKTVYQYDAYGKQSELLVYAYVNGTWVPSQGNQEIHTYGSFGEITHTEYSYYSEGEQKWIYQKKEDFFFSSLGVQTLKTNEIPLYPNPAKNRFYIDLNVPMLEVEAISAEGKVSPLLIENGAVCTEVLENGFYFIRVKTAKGIYMSRLHINR